MKKLILVLVIFLYFSASSSVAQVFFPRFKSSQAIGAQGKVVLTNGKTLEGKVGVALVNDVKVAKVTLTEKNGTKSKFKATDIEEVYIKASKFGNIVAITKADPADNILTSSKKLKDFDEMFKKDYYVFRKVLGNKGKPMVLQLLNPGFDSKIQVYSDPYAKKTASLGVGNVALVGGNDKSYYFAKGTKMGIVIKKNKYGKSFSSIYENCKEITIEFPAPKFKDAATHVYFYTQICK